MKFSIMTSPRQVTSQILFTDPDEICTAYVKLHSKHILFIRIFRFSINFHIYIYIHIYIYEIR